MKSRSVKLLVKQKGHQEKFYQSFLFFKQDGTHNIPVFGQTIGTTSYDRHCVTLKLVSFLFKGKHYYTQDYWRSNSHTSLKKMENQVGVVVGRFVIGNIFRKLFSLLMFRNVDPNSAHTIGILTTKKCQVMPKKLWLQKLHRILEILWFELRICKPL